MHDSSSRSRGRLALFECSCLVLPESLPGPGKTWYAIAFEYLQCHVVLTGMKFVSALSTCFKLSGVCSTYVSHAPSMVGPPGMIAYESAVPTLQPIGSLHGNHIGATVNRNRW